MAIKKVAEYAGITLAAIACPPVGLAWAAGKKRWMKGAVAGILISVGTSAIPLFCDKQLYDDPNVIVGRRAASDSRFIPQMVFSPLAFYLDGTSRATSLVGGDPKMSYCVEGDDVISFQDGKYKLNFRDSTGFSKDRALVEARNLDEAEARVRNSAQRLDGCVLEGDIFKTRKAREQLEWAQAKLVTVIGEYNEVRGAFQGVVDKMNSELETLASTGNQ